MGSKSERGNGQIIGLMDEIIKSFNGAIDMMSDILENKNKQKMPH